MSAKILSMHPEKDSEVVSEVIRLGSAVKRDIGRFVRLREQDDKNEKVQELMYNCKQRIYARLKKISELPHEYGISPEAWKKALRFALEKVHKHADSTLIQEEAEKLFGLYYLDESASKIHFVQAYMEIVGRIPPHHITIPFRPL